MHTSIYKGNVSIIERKRLDVGWCLSMFVVVAATPICTVSMEQFRETSLVVIHHK